MSREDPQAQARFLKESGRLEDAAGLYGSKAYRELIERRIQGATDADLVDLVGDLTDEMASNELTQLAGSVVLSEQVENRIAADGPPHEHGAGGVEAEGRGDVGSPTADTGSGPGEMHSRRRAPDLGWG